MLILNYVDEAKEDLKGPAVHSHLYKVKKKKTKKDKYSPVVFEISLVISLEDQLRLAGDQDCI